MTAKEFAPLIERYLGSVYNFAFRVANASDVAEKIAREVFLRAYIGRSKLPAERHLEAWLLKIAVHVSQRSLDGGASLSFDYLDDTIRGDPTQVTRTNVLADPERHLLLWELKQGCMTAVLNCLSLGERTAFTLVMVLGQSAEEAAATLDISPSALKVRLSRARKKIVSYLAPRCEHVHPTNPCHCPSRLGVALKKGFIQNIPGAEVKLRKAPPEAFQPSVPQRDVLAIYENLPPPGVPLHLLERLNEELLAGRWDEAVSNQ